MVVLNPDHFLALPRPVIGVGPPTGAPDTTTLAAHDFDIDTRTGFMPPQPPLTRLPPQWELWELVLEDGLASRLQLADKPDLSEGDRQRASLWQARIRELPILPTSQLKESEILLRRAHLVLAWLLHLYIRTLPPSLSEIRIPPPITVPLLQVSSHLQLPPVLTYSDDVLYNWALKEPVPLTIASPAPALDNLRCLTLFTGTRDEEEFYLSSARIELQGVQALTLMRGIMDEAFVGDSIAITRITSYLHSLAGVIGELTKLLLAVREGCDPQVFYNDIRPWFRGMDSDTNAKPWVFEGMEMDPTLRPPTELSGPSAGQSALIHALDVFLGVDRYSHASHVTGHQSSATKPSSKESAASLPLPLSTSPEASKPSVAFLTRMQLYMPRHHRAFLRHLSNSPRPIRSIVEKSNDERLTEAYNSAITALKVFRDAHVRIVAIYIVGPSRRGGRPVDEQKGTGGTSAIQFVKSVRDQTRGALLSQSQSSA
ncbi:tryptophan 2,3-dioxygenase [Cristinia sonorae]|uniref:Tryptophan 2,3-dioxygenase n=1 Tax=Cristinia sonorae TaxID=1940300 RepID=A0A8K0UK63_9AGAR|nr:tryptophan 2,3-dioxygenase [Cristinia sonorae]